MDTASRSTAETADGARGGWPMRREQDGLEAFEPGSAD